VRAGDPSQGINPLVELDIAGHEMSHGVTSRSAGLRYSGESGGLNESTASLNAATDLYGASSPERAAADQAWAAVNVRLTDPDGGFRSDAPEAAVRRTSKWSGLGRRGSAGGLIWTLPVGQVGSWARVSAVAAVLES